MHINTEKAYLIGLLIGGGIIKSNNLQIVLPYKKWGDLKINPERGGDIAEDILKRVKPLWKEHYNVDISYKIEKDWKILFQNISDELKADLTFFDLMKAGELRDNAVLSKFIPLLDNNDKIKSFIAGIVDTVGSLAKSHRRFSSEFQIVSLEFKGRNFQIVTDITKLLVQIGCTPDQILWNHPNQHSGLDRYYKSWKKGFKIRVALGDYVLKGGFVFASKQLSATKNQELQAKSNTSNGKVALMAGRTTLHTDENSEWLPPYIRGNHFIHYTHIAEYFGLHLPSSIMQSVTNYEKFICPFTLLTKGTDSEIKNIIKSEDYLTQTKYTFVDANIGELLSLHDRNKNDLIFGLSRNDGFLINYILQGIAFIYASSDSSKMKGKRVLGNYKKLLEKDMDNIKNIKIGLPSIGTCLYITNGKCSVLVGYINDEFNKKLISLDHYCLKIKSPLFSDCINLKS